jgi:hypothetical protein
VRLSIKFHPLLFQSSLAAGGVALMAFNYLQFAIPHGKGLITFANVPWSTLTPGQLALYVPLVAVMFLFTALNLGLNLYFLYRLARWLGTRGAYSAFRNNPHQNQNAGIFAIVASLSMSVNVFWTSLGFFVPQISGNMQALMVPSLVVFAILAAVLLFFQVTFGRTWFAAGVDRRGFNFVWLLDAFAFGLVSLTGSGIAALSTNGQIQDIASVATLFILAVGTVLLVSKVVYLGYTHLGAGKLPAVGVLPAFFLIVPIACLYGLSAYRIAEYLWPHPASGAHGAESLLITAAYVLAVVWALGVIYLIRDYFRRTVVKSQFAPSQWGFV